MVHRYKRVQQIAIPSDAILAKKDQAFTCEVPEQFKPERDRDLTPFLKVRGHLVRRAGWFILNNLKTQRCCQFYKYRVI